MQKSLVTLACCACFCAGCAHVEVTHVDDKDKSDGVHFYEPRPYLLVTKTASASGPNELTNQIIWLPDHNKRFKVEFKGGWGTMNGSVKLQNGWLLDTLGAQTDSKIPETITAVGGLITAIAKITSLVAPAKPLEEGLYLIDIDEKGLVWFMRTGWVK
jgi:hypothetical protein